MAKVDTSIQAHSESATRFGSTADIAPDAIRQITDNAIIHPELFPVAMELCLSFCFFSFRRMATIV